MKVVFDTNVFISAFLTATGPSYYALHLSIRHHEVIVSEYILRETQTKLVDKLGFTAAQVEPLIRFVRSRFTVARSGSHARIRFSDPKDIPILGLVKSERAHCLVTGDKKLLALKKYHTALILSPREAMELLR